TFAPISAPGYWLARTTLVCAIAGPLDDIKINERASNNDELRVFMQKHPLELIWLTGARKSFLDRLAQTIRPQRHQHRTVYENSRRAFNAVSFAVFNVPANVCVKAATVQVGIE